MQNKKWLALFFSIVPGAGHMYLGMTRRGVQLMVLFFLTFYLAQSLHTDLLIVFAPIIWFYSFFDARVKAHSQEFKDDDLEIISWISKKENLKGKARFGGILLIVIGTFALINETILPLINIPITWQIQQAIRQAIIPIALIAIGLKLISPTSVNLGIKTKEVAGCEKGE